ncbi:MAG: phage holin family protein [Candidatus Velthaea sp.]|jgi:putative membrane protein
MGLLLRIIVNALALLAVGYFVPGVHVDGFLGALLAAIVLGVVNAILRPILILLTLPFEILTLGLFTFVINALLFWFVGHLGVGLTVDGFWPAFIGTIVLSIVSLVLSALVGTADKS